MSPPGERDARFVEHLEQLVAKQDRGALAALRRGLGKQPGEAPEMYPYVVRWAQGGRPWQERVYYLVASLFAWHQGSWHGDASKHEVTNLGASFARLAPQGAENRPGVERRFVALLNCHRDDLPNHLRHAVGLLKSKGIPLPIDWAQLLHDIQGWDSEHRWVQLAWARAFWGQAAPTSEEPAETLVAASV
ncbi:MAG: type I-E CRISPR-associated protein Cse2/CasB [Chloroflexi bacterium]|nr:type I-E CRISPR-associated protein Cse2/CasB [Chloroflexota bacterium]